MNRADQAIRDKAIAADAPNMSARELAEKYHKSYGAVYLR